MAFLNLMSTFRLQAVRVQELKFQMAVRDQIISEQREVISNLWRIIDKSGMGKHRVLEIAKQEGIIMDGALPPLEEPRPITASADGGVGGVHDGRGDPALPGFYAAQDAVQVATPNASLVGNRAKMRYRFWAQYNGPSELQGVGEDYAFGDERDVGQDRDSSPSKAARASGRRGKPGGAGAGGGGGGGGGAGHGRGKDGGGPAGGAAAAGGGAGGGGRRKGAGIRVEHLAHLHPPANGRRRGGGNAAANGGAGGGGGGGAAQAAAGQAALSKAVAAASEGRVSGAGGSYHSKGHTVQSGRRAGQPAAGGRLSVGQQHEPLLDLSNVSNADGPASYRAQDEDGGGGGVMRAWGEQPSAAAAPRPPVVPPLGERLARIKAGRQRKTESDGVMTDLPPQGPGSQGPPGGSAPTTAGGAGGEGEDGGKPAVAQSAIQATLAVAGVGLLNARPPSRTKTQTPVLGGGDALDQHVQQHRRLSSAGSAQAAGG